MNRNHSRKSKVKKLAAQNRPEAAADTATLSEETAARRGGGRPVVTARPANKNPRKIKETGGPAGPEPTRYGDWERNGRCIDF